MCAVTAGKDSVATVPIGVGDAVGVSGAQSSATADVVCETFPRRWYVAIVNHNTEKKVAERLSGAGHEVWVASQQVRRIWKNGRKAMIDRVVIPSKVFVKCTESERRELVKLSYINRFLSDRALSGVSGAAKLATIPQDQIDRLRFMLGQSDIPVEISSVPFKPGDHITVVRGSLKGLRGEIVRVAEGKTELAVQIDLLGCARVTIASVDVIIEKDK